MITVTFRSHRVESRLWSLSTRKAKWIERDDQRSVSLVAPFLFVHSTIIVCRQCLSSLNHLCVSSARLGPLMHKLTYVSLYSTICIRAVNLIPSNHRPWTDAVCVTQTSQSMGLDWLMGISTEKNFEQSRFTMLVGISDRQATCDAFDGWWRIGSMNHLR